jgi:hypothetical protein
MYAGARMWDIISGERHSDKLIYKKLKQITYINK